MVTKKFTIDIRGGDVKLKEDIDKNFKIKIEFEKFCECEKNQFNKKSIK